MSSQFEIGYTESMDDHKKQHTPNNKEYNHHKDTKLDSPELVFLDFSSLSAKLEEFLTYETNGAVQSSSSTTLTHALVVKPTKDVPRLSISNSSFDSNSPLEDITLIEGAHGREDFSPYETLEVTEPKFELGSVNNYEYIYSSDDGLGTNDIMGTFSKNPGNYTYVKVKSEDFTTLDAQNSIFQNESPYRAIPPQIPLLGIPQLNNTGINPIKQLIPKKFCDIDYDLSEFAYQTLETSFQVTRPPYSQQNYYMDTGITNYKYPHNRYNHNTAINGDKLINMIHSSIQNPSITTINEKIPRSHCSPPRRSHNISKGSKISKRRQTAKEFYDYSGVKDRGYKHVIQQTNLRNIAKLESEEDIEKKIEPILVRFKRNEEARVINIKRTRYVRGNLDCLDGLHENTRYEKNLLFGIDRPYEPEFIRFNVNPQTKLPDNTTRAGLCAYCPEIEFRNLKTSTYAQHLTLWHGIHTDNYLTPNPSHYGVYKLCKNKNLDTRKTTARVSSRNGVVCPVCHEVVETECSKKTNDKPLSGYLRHFRDYHRQTQFKGELDLYFNLQMD